MSIATGEALRPLRLDPPRMRRPLTLTLLVCLVAVALPAGAQAATTYTVRGAGYGHGIGMSQYGAQGFAKQGRSYREILAHYYRGTELGAAGTSTIRVLLQAGGGASFSGATRVPGQRNLTKGRTYVVRRAGAGLELRSTRGTVVARSAGVLRVDAEGQPLKLGGRAINGVTGGRYRGALEFRPSGSGVMTVNAVGLDDYVQGVVPGEMPTSWEPHALRAQSVAARSYALTTDRGGVAFDQYPDTRSQVYRGADSEVASSNAAVQATAGEVLRYNGKIAVTYFFSTSGGRTENIEKSWPGATPQPYLKSVADPYDNLSPKHRWRFTFTAAQMKARLGRLVKGSFRGIRVLERGVSPRIVRAEVIGSRGRTPVDGATLRWRLGLFDTWAYFGAVTTEEREQTAPGSEGTSGGALAAGSWLDRIVRPRSVSGSVTPVPARRRIVVQRRTPRGWNTVRGARTGADGRYRVAVSKRGTYRVRAGGFAGPPVRIR